MSISAYLPILIVGILALGFYGVTRLLSALLAPNDPTPEKLEPYECGIVPESEPAERFPVQFYLVAMLFIAFDIEIIFLYPWALIMRELRWFGFFEMAVFVAIVLIAYGYIRREGILDWAPKRHVDRADLMQRYHDEAMAAKAAAEKARAAAAAGSPASPPAGPKETEAA